MTLLLQRRSNSSNNAAALHPRTSTPPTSRFLPPFVSFHRPISIFLLRFIIHAASRPSASLERGESILTLSICCCSFGRIFTGNRHPPRLTPFPTFRILSLVSYELPNQPGYHFPPKYSYLRIRRNFLPYLIDHKRPALFPDTSGYLYLRFSSEPSVILSARSATVRMDMTSLSSTLPGNSQNPKASKQTSPEPSSQVDDGQALMEAFQSAARSVTHLYRSSASLIRNSRQEGYRDALSDVLEAIDNESAYNDPALALSRIRDWVIDRRHDVRGTSGGSGPAPSRQQREMSAESEAEETSSGKEEDRQNLVPQQQQQHHQNQPHQSIIPQSVPFSFQSPTSLTRSSHNPSDIVQPLQPLEGGGMFTFNSPVVAPPLHNRSSQSKGPLTPKSGNASGLGSGAGTKRRNQQVDFFDLGGFGNFNFNSGNNNGPGGGGGGSCGYGPGNAKRGKFM